jgi:MFS family permease
MHGANVGMLEMLAQPRHTDSMWCAQPQVFGITMSCWAIGSIIGPGLGGVVAEPCRIWRRWAAASVCASRTALLQRFPFVIPCTGAAVLCALSALLAHFLLHPEAAVYCHQCLPWI